MTFVSGVRYPRTKGRTGSVRDRTAPGAYSGRAPGGDHFASAFSVAFSVSV